MKNPLRLLYFDPALISLLRKQPALILKLAQQQRKFLQVVLHPDKMGASFHDYSAELNEAMDQIKDREQLEHYIEEYLQEISNTDMIKRELAVQRSRVENLQEAEKEARKEKEHLQEQIQDLENRIVSLKESAREQLLSWLVYRRPFTKVLVPDTRFFLPEMKNMVIEVGDEHYLTLYFMFNWEEVRIIDGKRELAEMNLAKMHELYREKGKLPGRKLPLQYIAGCIGNEPLLEADMLLCEASTEIMTISPFLEVGKRLVTCTLSKKKRDPEPTVSFMKRGIITDLREFSLEQS